eukprot:4820742-Prymnesium_polylepis.1
MQVELWDCSGDRRYENCWTAILRETNGVVMVYDPTIKEQEKDIEMWYKSFVAPLGLPDSQILILGHQARAVGGRAYQVCTFEITLRGATPPQPICVPELLARFGRPIQQLAGELQHAAQRRRDDCARALQGLSLIHI